MHFAYTALCDELLDRVAADVATGQHRESIARACLERPQGGCPSKGSGVVPRGEHIINAKPQQDLRFDMPTVGIGTLESLGEAGARVLAIEAEKTILVDAPALLDFAERQGITIVSFPDGAFSGISGMARAA